MVNIQNLIVEIPGTFVKVSNGKSSCDSLYLVKQGDSVDIGLTMERLSFTQLHK
jgi:hypothetical protein